MRLKRHVHGRYPLDEHAFPAKVQHVGTTPEHAHDEGPTGHRPRHMIGGQPQMMRGDRATPDLRAEEISGATDGPFLAQCASKALLRASATWGSFIR